jgi:putative peptidoglycan lipid II flippase
MTLLSRISGFARDVALSYFFGASGIADAFFVAFRIPNFFRRLFAEGAFNQAFVPILARYRAGARVEMLEFIRVMSGNLGAILLLVVVAGTLLAPVLVSVFAPGFIADTPRFELTTELVRITFPYIGFISLTALAGALLNSHHRYAVPAFTPVLLNVSLIASALLASTWASRPVIAVAWGVLFAGVAQLLFQLPSLMRLGLIVQPRIDVRHEGARRVGTLLLPAIFASSAGQINALIDTMLASTLTTGSISWLYYSDRLLELPIGLVAVALGTVLLPNLSRLHREDNLEGFHATLGWGVRVATFFALPAAVALFVLALPLISTIFQHGALTVVDATMASLSLEAFAVGLLPLVLVKVLAPAYFAREDTRSPLRAAAFAVAVNVVVNLALFRLIGHIGLAIGTSCAAWVNMLLLARGLRHAERLRLDAASRRLFLVCGLAAASMALVLVLITPAGPWWLNADVMARVWRLSGVVLAGATVYTAIALMCGVRPRQLLHRV